MTKRKGMREYAPSNVTPDGDYVVGKGKPPDSGKFRVGDGRQRGRRRKGTKNLATDLREELDARVTVTVGGASKKISRQRAIVMRLADNATKGQNPAIAMTLDYQQRLVGPLLAKEEEARSSEDQPNWSLLSMEERCFVEYAISKAYGLKYTDRVPQLVAAPSYGPVVVSTDPLNQESGEGDKGDEVD